MKETLRDGIVPRQFAEARQREASDPAASVFVAASAGSGKTKLLTDRLLRLMLAGAPAERLLCLTYTRAAAAEMKLRLHARLASWVAAPEAELNRALASLGYAADEELCRRARELFGCVLDLPGGMRIDTIHAFCQSLLRRFPLEARLSPHFTLIEDADAALALAAAREHMLAYAPGSAREALIPLLAEAITEPQFAGLIEQLKDHGAEIAEAADRGEALAGVIAAGLGASGGNEETLMAEMLAPPDEAGLCSAAAAICDHPDASDATRQRAGAIRVWLARDPEQRRTAWPEWRELFLTKEDKPRAKSGFLVKAVDQARPECWPRIEAEQQRILSLLDRLGAWEIARYAAAAARLAAPVLRDYAATKEQRAALDYHDLIARTRDLLRDPGAAWVLYKLDGGIDHLLLDEAQDTAPEQSRIVDALTTEFFAGASARSEQRSFFAVGDRKQSIFSFQGADPTQFDDWRQHLGSRVRGAGQEWREIDLPVSFRSTAPVLKLVDAVFADREAAAGVVAPGETLSHFADRAGAAGSVELWPLTPSPKEESPEPWGLPRAYAAAKPAPERLAAALAEWLARETAGGVALKSRGRALVPGDVLVLLRHRYRNPFPAALVRALKAAGVPVAGLDRMLLTEQPAVADLLALCESLLLPEDDLALACLLTSPIGGLDQESLMALAMDRKGKLIEALRARAAEREDWQRAERFFAALLKRADFVSPHALLAQALGEGGARARLLARFGQEAAEPVDELLEAALDFARVHPPSLQAFVHWLRHSAAEIKREAEAAGDAVRIMTVHGAKGLEAPLVILPDTTALPPVPKAVKQVVWLTAPDRTPLPLWRPDSSAGCAKLNERLALARQLAAEEHNRLLYVALTRAEDRLVICGAAPRKALPEPCWYRLVQKGFARLDGIVRAPFALVSDPWPGEWLGFSSPQRDLPRSPRVAAEETPRPLPAWLGSAPDWRPALPPPEPKPSIPLAPSRPENTTLGPLPAVASPLAGGEARARFARGALVHTLLEHLPAVPGAERRAAAVRLIALEQPAMPAAERIALAEEVMAILDHPELASLFGPDSRAEQPLAGVIGKSVGGGLVDRMAVLADRVLLADYKANRDPPGSAEEVPLLYLRQMAAYRAILAQIFPARPIVCHLIWTRAARVMVLPNALLDAHAPAQD